MLNLAKKQKKIAEQNKVKISSFNIIYELIDFVKNQMSGLLSPDVEEKVIGSAEILEIFKVSKVGKVAGSKVVEGEITQDSSARVIRDGAIIFNGKISSIFREKNQTKQVSAGLECGITLKDFVDFQKNELTFLGNVYFSQSGSTLKAEKAVINTETGSASMMGSVKTILMPPRREGNDG